MRPQNKIKIKWSPDFAYAIGLLVTDGNLSPDGRHINFTSKDKELVIRFRKTLGLQNSIGLKARAKEKEKKYFLVQFGDVNFYKFLMNIGLMPKKSKILSALDIPDEYFFDFLRGHFDGDGTFYSYWDPRWRSSYMFYTCFISASKNHIYWLQDKISVFLNIKGHITKSSGHACYQLKYAKSDSLKLLERLYYSKKIPHLKRKRLKIIKALHKIKKSLKK